jgi:hypothetical protein
MQPYSRAARVARSLATLIALCTSLPTLAGAAGEGHDPNRSLYRAPLATQAPTIDGVPDDAAWNAAPWRELDQRWLGPEYGEDDFQGRFKVVWTRDRLYLLAEITDDILIDRYRDPLERYWDDDCLEIFVDEDFSGGNHQFNHNAFAYHLSLDNRAIDIGTDRQARDYSHHVLSRWRQDQGKLYWEVAIDIYTDRYVDDSRDNTPVALEQGKVMGLLVAYCDNDGSEIRENFIGSEVAAGDHKDRGWIDAGLFGRLELAGPAP